jgi:hypothetical protein
MLESIFRVITAYKRRFVRHVKRRSSSERLKARRYYRVHKAKIKLQRKRYIRKNKLFMRTRKLFKRVKPAWLSPKKSRQPTKKKFHPHAKRPKSVRKPLRPKIRKVHAPRRKRPVSRRRHD